MEPDTYSNALRNTVQGINTLAAWARLLVYMFVDTCAFISREEGISTSICLTLTSIAFESPPPLSRVFVFGVFDFH